MVLYSTVFIGAYVSRSRSQITDLQIHRLDTDP